jgi:hypothetical protein
LPEIRRSVANSARSHYDRKDLQALFQLQPRAAGALLDMLPKVKVGQAHLVERDALGRFLDRVHRAENVTAAVMAQRAEREAATRRKPRALVRRDHEVVSAASLSHWLTRGHLHIHFETAQELSDALWRVAISMQEDLEAFVSLYEPVPEQGQPDAARAEIDAMFARLRTMEAARKEAGL